MEASPLNEFDGSMPVMSLKDRVKEAMGKMTQAELAKAAEVSDAAVAHWLSGDTKTLKGENALKLERVTGYSAQWLISGKPPKRTSPAQQYGEHPVYAGRRAGVRSVPIVGMAKMGTSGFYEEVSSIPGAGDGKIDIATADPNAYGLKVRGNSMAPAIRDGWYVVVEPGAVPAVGEYVLVQLTDGQKMVKELLYQRNDCIELLSVNDGERITVYMEDLDSIQPVAAIVPPSKWRPD